MRQQGQRALVVMTNGDVYYLQVDEAEALIESLHTKRFEVFRFKDAKSGASVVVHLRNISSMVVEETPRG